MDKEDIIKYAIIVLVFISLVTIVLILKSKKEINPDDLTVNISKIEEGNYKIHIDCKLISESKSFDLIVNQSKASDLCKGFFPELFKLKIGEIK